MTRLILPLPPSVNHSHKQINVRGRLAKVPTKETEQYKKDAGWVAKQWMMRTGWVPPDAGEKIVLCTWTYWRTAGRQDTHNRIKVLADALEGILYPDDRWVLLQEQDFAIDKQSPRIEIELRRMDHVNRV